MALANYTDLQAALASWLARTDLTTAIVDVIALGEAGLNRELGAIETNTTLTGTLNSRTVSISSLAFVSSIALFIVETSGDETEIMQQAEGTYPRSGTSGPPSWFSIDGTNIIFDRPLDVAYSIRFRYRQKFNLATTATNWLLTNHPDVYLAACMVWGAGYIRDAATGMNFKALLDEGLPSVKSIIARNKRGRLIVDAGLLGGHGRYTKAELEAGLI
jgi:hypothetical protein